MIEPTDEMVAAYATAWRERLFKPPQDTERPAVRAGLAAVLAIVERGQAEELADLRRLFDLQWRRMGEATAMWRAEDPESRANVLPDLGDLLAWLMARIEKLETVDVEPPRCSGQVVTFAPAPCGRDHTHPAHNLGLPPQSPASATREGLTRD